MTRRLSIVIPCRNEERNVVRCLDAIGRQTYPHQAMEVLVADGRSTDRTHALIAQWRQAHDVDVRIVDNPRIVAEFGNAEAMKQVTGEVVYLMGMDEEMAQDDMVETLVGCFDRFPDIVGVEQEFLPVPGGNWVNNYLAVLHINDPLAREIARMPRLLEHVCADGRHYRKWEFAPGYPAKLFFLRSAIEPFLQADTFEEGQVMLALARRGANRMATVDGYGVYHHNVKSLRDYARKRWKIALKHSTRASERKTWVDYGRMSPHLGALILLTFVYPFAGSVVRAARSRRPVWLLHAPVAFAVVWIYAVSRLVIRITKRRAW